MLCGAFWVLASNHLRGLRTPRLGCRHVFSSTSGGSGEWDCMMDRLETARRREPSIPGNPISQGVTRSTQSKPEKVQALYHGTAQRAERMTGLFLGKKCTLYSAEQSLHVRGQWSIRQTSPGFRLWILMGSYTRRPSADRHRTTIEGRAAS
jgi:hypothetical protein